MQSPLFSIIIPTFNSGKTLVNCLESILSQSFKDFEICIVDGLSDDCTPKIIKEYKTRYEFIKVIAEPDDGIYDAMNKGIEIASGSWLYFLGSDDILNNSTVFERISDILYLSPETKAVYGNVLMRGQNKWNLQNCVYNGEYNLEKILRDTICHQALFYKKELFSIYGKYNKDYTVSADYDFNLRCYAGEVFMYADIVVADFFVGGHSTTTTDTKFQNDRGSLMLSYFGKRIFKRSFMTSRLYLREAALSLKSPLSFPKRIVCLLAYLKLKFQCEIEKNV